MLYKSLYVYPTITPGMESQSQSESQSSPSAPSDNKKEYKEVPIDSLNLVAQEALLTSPSTGEIESCGILVLYLAWESIK